MVTSITLDQALYYKIWNPLNMYESSQLEFRKLYVQQFGLTLYESLSKYDEYWWGTLKGEEKALTWFLLKHT